MKNLALTLLLVLTLAGSTLAKASRDNHPALSSEKSAQIIIQARELTNTLHLNEADYLKIKEVLKTKFIQIENARLVADSQETLTADIEKINKQTNEAILALLNKQQQILFASIKN